MVAVSMQQLDAVSVFCGGLSVTHTSQSEGAVRSQNGLCGLIKVMFQAATWPIRRHTHYSHL